MRPLLDGIKYMLRARAVKARRSSRSVARLRGFGIVAWVAARRAVAAGRSRTAFLQSRLARYLVTAPPSLLRFLPPLEITADGRLQRGAFDARVPSDFVLGDPSVEPPPAATHPLAAAIRFAAAALNTLRARAMQRITEIEEARQRATADIRQVREEQERHRNDLQRCQAAALQIVATNPRIWPAFLAWAAAGAIYGFALCVETAWFTTSLADSIGIDLATPAAAWQSAHLVVPLIGTAGFVTFVLVSAIRFVTTVVVRFATARTVQDARFAPLFGAFGAVLFVLLLLASIAWLRGRYSAAAIGADESVYMQLALTGFHLAMLIGGAIAAGKLTPHRQALVALYNDRDAFHRKRDTHAQALAFMGVRLRETERRLDELQDARTRFDVEHEQAIADLEAHLRSLLQAGEAIKEQRAAWLNALDAALSADTETFTACAHRYGRDDLLPSDLGAAVLRRLR